MATLTELRYLLRSRLQDLESIDYKDNELNLYINQAYVETLRKSKCATTKINVNSVSGTATYSTGVIFDVMHVWYNAVLLTNIDVKSMTTLYGGWVNNGADTTQQYWWKPDGRNISIANTPSENNKVIQIQGYCIDTDMQLDTDEPDMLPRGFDFMLVDYAEYRARMDRQSRSGNIDLAAVAKKSYDEALVELISIHGGK